MKQLLFCKEFFLLNTVALFPDERQNNQSIFVSNYLTQSRRTAVVPQSEIIELNG